MSYAKNEWNLHRDKIAEDPLEDGESVETNGSNESGGLVDVVGVDAEALLGVGGVRRGDRKYRRILLLVRLKKKPLRASKNVCLGQTNQRFDLISRAHPVFFYQIN